MNINAWAKKKKKNLLNNCDNYKKTHLEVYQLSYLQLTQYFLNLALALCCEGEGIQTTWLDLLHCVFLFCLCLTSCHVVIMCCSLSHSITLHRVTWHSNLTWYQWCIRTECQSVPSPHRWGYICIGASESSWSEPARLRHLSARRLLFNCFIIVRLIPLQFRHSHFLH